MSIDYFTRVQASSGWSRVLEGFAHFVEPRAGWRTLDAGCGPGALVRHLAHLGCEASGVDADRGMVDKARELAAEVDAGLAAEGAAKPLGAEFRVGNVLALPFPNSEFDLVTASNVLFLLPEPLAGLREMARVCRPGGTVAILNPSSRLSRAAAEAYAAQAGLGEFEAFSLAKWGGVSEAHQRFSQADVEVMYAAAGLQPPEIAEKVGPGFALFARGRKPQDSEKSP